MAPNGYAWWYLDALSDDGRNGLTIIAFIGSVFSPYYAQARQSGPADPMRHCALNVALYGPWRHQWAMTERMPEAVGREAATLAIGPSAMSWDGEALTVSIDEMTNPLPFPIKGTVKLFPHALTKRAFSLHENGRHRWQPMAPSARVEVRLQQPGLSWAGPGYLDMNCGEESLEAGFRQWDWRRAAMREGAAILYDVICRNGEKRSLALQIDRAGEVREAPPPPPARLPHTLWRVARSTRADAGHKARIVKTLEDTPFYTRSVVASRLFGEEASGMHESLSLDRFAARWVQALLPYRMPRR